MPGYCESCIAFLGNDNVKKFSTPSDANLFSIDETSSPLNAERSELFHSCVAKILYLATRVRPDILATVSFLCSRVQAPTEQDWSKLERLIGYLSNTVNYGLFYRANAPVESMAYVDASHGTHPDDGTSRTGIIITMSGGPICWRSSKQKIVTLSSTEAELVALTEGSNYVLWLRNVMSDLQLTDRGPTVVYQDNMSTLALVRNDKTKQQRTRHLNVKYFAIRERVRERYINLIHLNGSDMIADILTKSVDVSTLHRLLPRFMHLHAV
jgi:hypothetical protein